MLEQLHRAWLARLRTEWQTVNRDRLADRLQPPVMQIDRGTTVRLGRWQVTGRILAISEQHVWDHPWEEVLETLKHEMAHQYASEVLGNTGETAHGPGFAEACRLVGVAARATGTPGTGDRSGADRILGKVRKLLALAASPNVHEAETAMAAANTLLLKYNLELTGSPEAAGYGWRRIGSTSAALPVEAKLVASILSQFFFVECIWVSVYNARRDRMERQLELIGTETNLELAAYAHDFLHHACNGLWRGAQRTLAARGRESRREFVAGVLTGFSHKLKAERETHAGRGLIWLGDPNVKRFFRDRYPSTRTLGGGGVRRGAAHDAGMAAGRELRIHKGVESRGSGGGLLGRSP